MNLKQALAGTLPPDELAQLPKSFDIVGDIAILEIPEPLLKRQEKIVAAIRRMHPRLKTVLAKGGGRGGLLRLRAFVILHGGTTETVHTEYGAQLALDLATVYFSPREAEERQRIAGQVRPKERVLVLFAGAGPYAVAIAKREPSARVVAVEINPHGFYYLCWNALLNKLDSRITPVLGDAKRFLARRAARRAFDRVVMPLPKGGSRFLPAALRALKAGGRVHFYAVESEKTGFSQAERALRAAAAKAGVRIATLTARHVLPYGPRVWKVCVDAQAGGPKQRPAASPKRKKPAKKTGFRRSGRRKTPAARRR